MRFEDEIYFSRNYEWTSINVLDPEDLVVKFEDRVTTIYLEQARKLIKDEKNSFYNSFAAGIILFCTIEWLGTFLTSKSGFKNKLNVFLQQSSYFTAFDKKEQDTITKTIVECFRNGIVHNGRVKEACQFDIFFDKKLFVVNNGLLIINTEPLYDLVANVLLEYVKLLKKDQGERDEFVNIFKKEFKSELTKLA